MKPHHFFLVLIYGLLAMSLPAASAPAMDKELADFAHQLATLVNENGKKKVTVLDFTDLQGGGSELGKYLAEELTVNLVMLKSNFAVLDRANLASILREHKLTATGLVDPENAKKLGQFAGVDALIIGTIVPMNDALQLNAKLITTDTAEIVGATRIMLKTNEMTQQLVSRPAAASGPLGGEPRPKPFGDLEVKIESMKLLPGDAVYGFGLLTFIITNASESKTYGVAIHPDPYKHFNLSNSRGDVFRVTETSGIGKAFDVDGTFHGSLTDVLPRTAITITAKSQVRWTGKPGDYRPYRLQTELIFGPEENGRYSQLKKHNLVVDIK